jgi:hypothetical protein
VAAWLLLSRSLGGRTPRVLLPRLQLLPLRCHGEYALLVVVCVCVFFHAGVQRSRQADELRPWWRQGGGGELTLVNCHAGGCSPEAPGSVQWTVDEPEHVGR